MQQNTDSTTVERVEQPVHGSTIKPDPIGLVAALVAAGLFACWLWCDMSKERKWLAERKRRLDHFRDVAHRRHDELVSLQFRERLAAHVTRVVPPAAIKTPVDTTPKQRKIFKLYG